MYKPLRVFILPAVMGIAMLLPSGITCAADPQSAIGHLETKLQQTQNMQNELTRQLQESRRMQEELSQQRLQAEARESEREKQLSAQVQAVQQQAEEQGKQLGTQVQALQQRVEEQSKQLSAQMQPLNSYEGFSYYGTSSHPAGWSSIPDISKLDFNTFGTNTYNGVTSTFIAPKSGYYRFSSHGYIATQGTSNERVAIGIYLNGTLRAFSGGQFSAIDTPGPQFIHVVKLNVGDTVTPAAFTAIACSIGSSGQNHSWWFQGEYIGE